MRNLPVATLAAFSSRAESRSGRLASECDDPVIRGRSAAGDNEQPSRPTGAGGVLEQDVLEGPADFSPRGGSRNAQTARGCSASGSCPG